MKYKAIYPLILFLLLIGCSKQEKLGIKGVWYLTSSEKPDHYSEVHITDTGYVVVRENGLSYLATYRLKSDTLIQYLRDHFVDLKITDTLEFTIERKQDSLELVNVINTEARSKWVRINSVDPYTFGGDQALDSFVQKFRMRYFKNYVSRFVPENFVDKAMHNFDSSWGIQEKPLK